MGLNPWQCRGTFEVYDATLAILRMWDHKCLCIESRYFDKESKF